MNEGFEKYKLPKARFTFGQEALTHWKEVECGITKGVITGVSLGDHNRPTCVVYEVKELTDAGLLKAGGTTGIRHWPRYVPAQ